MELKYIYDNIQNPLDNNTIRYIYDNYGFVPTYNIVVGLGTKPNTRFDIPQRDKYNKMLFDIWKNSILNLSMERIEELEKRFLYKDIRRIRHRLSMPLDEKYNLNTTLGIYDFLTEEKMDKAYFCMPENLLNHRFVHTISEKVDLSEDTYFDVEHRLYVNIANENVYKLAHKLVEKFGEKNLPFYFKFEDLNNRKDGFVIYSDTKNLAKYSECLDEVYSENKELRMSTYSPLMFGGRISDYYCIGDEPNIEDKSYSFNTLRAECIDNAMTRSIRRWMYENQDVDLKRNGKIVKFKDYMTDKIVDLLINDIYSGENKYKNYHNLHENVFSAKNIGELKKSLKVGVDGYINGKKLEPMKVYENLWLDEARDKPSKLQGIFSMGIDPSKNTRPNFLGSVSPSIIDELIKVELGSKIIHRFSDSSGYFKHYLLEELRKNNIDVNKPCFNIGTEEKFNNPDYWHQI